MTQFAKLCAAQVIGNAALLALGYYWLGVGESDAARLVLSASTLLLIACGAAWLHGMSLSYFRDSHTGLDAIPRQPLRRWLPLVLMAAIAVTCYFAAEYWNPLTDERINRTASYLTLTFQTPVRPASIERVFGALWWVVRWMLLPVVLLSAASGVAAHGWQGFAELGARLRSWRLWLLVPVLLLMAVWLPFRLMAWTPAMPGFWMEAASVAVRFGLAYLFFVAGALLLAFAASRGRPLESQDSTTVSP